MACRRSGYDVKDRKLVVNDVEARTVGDIYRRYLALKSVRALADDFAAAGIREQFDGCILNEEQLSQAERAV